jgi:aldehyde dehydrogenase (NAD+)
MQSNAAAVTERKNGKPEHEASRVVADLRRVFESGRTRPLEWRVAQLEGLERMCVECEKEIIEALRADLGRPAFETYGTEIGFLKADARHARKHLKKWMKAERVSAPMVTQPGRAEIHHDPLGVVLVIAPWNYPFQLALSPLVGAIAGGNCAVVKPSEIAPHTSAFIAKRLGEFVDSQAIAVVEGGVAETTALLAERFDHIFYTGNGTVGRIVMRAAAEHLTPVTLELGGKSPAIVDRDVDLEMACRRIALGKFANAGQTCVAPDYVLVHEEIKGAFLERLSAVVEEFYGLDPKASDSYARIVNERHHDRLTKLLGAGTVVTGGESDRETRYIAPTVLRDVPDDAPIMKDEIFGPILPVRSVASIGEAIAFVNAREKPLALYIFTKSRENADEILARTTSGGVTVNHTLLHLAAPGLPFGGVGASGMGHYHGKFSFETFTHAKAVLRKPLALDPTLFYPPYSDAADTWLRRLL